MFVFIDYKSTSFCFHYINKDSVSLPSTVLGACCIQSCFFTSEMKSAMLWEFKQGNRVKSAADNSIYGERLITAERLEIGLENFILEI